MRALLALAAVAVAVLAGRGLVDPGTPGGVTTTAGGSETARVLDVVDGDTIGVRLDGRREPVRVIGIDTPEPRPRGGGAECFAAEASAEMRRLVGGREVQLVTDREPRDRYERLLAYVEVPRDGERDLDAGAVLLRGGFARPLRIAPNTARAAAYAALAAEARLAGRGLWSACPNG